ncbi:alpha/beta hydrolase [Rhodococcus sp. USK10]|uniref:alpha/beta hydrolase n=1 Tax=Rhodococcus sp. USK10 TaxID=2789739 RepID=UPI001C605855|nr:alpha/beta hydrolase [Rhodococcus sp. USK10]QYB02223.1 alpha/beta hydrolase [Rhodococcus sp. USK10]
MTRKIADIAPTIDYESVTSPALLMPPPVSALPATVSHRGVIYAAVPGWRPLRLDLHLPTSGGPWPVVLYIHGGSLVGGVREMGPWTTLPSRGIAVASASYRLAAEVSFPEPVEDVRAAVRWLRRHARGWNLDPERLSLWGSSAGALLAGIAGVSGDRTLGRTIGDGAESTVVRSVIAHYGVADARALTTDADPGGARAAADLSAIVDLYTANSNVAPAVAPHITDGVRPDYLLVHGNADCRVGHAQSVDLHAALLNAGFNSTLRIVEGADHGAAEFADDTRTEWALTFLRESWKE